MPSKPLSEERIDVLINVFAKPWQTALSLLTLLQHSGQYIDKIYFHEEPVTSEFERKNHKALLAYLPKEVIYYRPVHWLSSNTVDEGRLVEEEYRLSMRYQYGFEHSDKKYVLLIHNDIEVLGDIVGALLTKALERENDVNTAECTAIGELGQCWWCPAGQLGYCSSEKYESFRPKYHQLMYIYNQNMDYTQRRAYNLGLKQEFWERPWPLPECRINEWCMLVNVHKARPATLPHGPARPLGGQFASGAKIGEDWEHIVNLDTGVQWFRDLHGLGHSFAHYPIEEFIVHERKGKVALGAAEKYIHAETIAKLKIQATFPHYFARAVQQ